MTEVLLPQKGPQTLFQTGALGPGSTLWVIPQGDQSEWKKKLDWYLNFQISKSENYTSFHVSTDFTNFLKSYDMELKPRNKTSRLNMISCENFLPCKMLIIIPINETDFHHWIHNIFQVWTQLLKPQFRIFLPFNFPIVDFMSMWPDKNSATDITLVPSQK